MPSPVSVSAIFDSGDSHHKLDKCFRKLWASPDDGAHVLASYADGEIRQFIFNDGDEGKKGGPLFTRLTGCDVLLTSPLLDAAWCPFKKGTDNAAFITAASKVPLQMWDATDGELRGTYRSINSMGEPMSPHSCLWMAGGHKIVGGYGTDSNVDESVVLYDIANPGQNAAVVSYKNNGLCSGPVSCLEEVPGHSLLAAGRYESNVVELFDHRITKCAGILRGHTGGITKIQRSPLDELHLVTGSRTPDGSMKVWDLRNVAKPVVTLQRRMNDHQYIGFDIVTNKDLLKKLGVEMNEANQEDGSFSLLTGGAHGCMDVFHVNPKTSVDGGVEAQSAAGTIQFQLPAPAESKRWFESPIGAVVVGGSSGKYVCFSRGARVYRRFNQALVDRKAIKKSAQATHVAATSTPVDNEAPKAANVEEAGEGEIEEVKLVKPIITRKEVVTGSDTDEDVAATMSAKNKKRLRCDDSTTGVVFSDDDQDEEGPVKPGPRSTVAFVSL